MANYDDAVIEMTEWIVNAFTYLDSSNAMFSNPAREDFLNQSYEDQLDMVSGMMAMGGLVVSASAPMPLAFAYSQANALTSMANLFAKINSGSLRADDVVGFIAAMAGQFAALPIPQAKIVAAGLTITQLLMKYLGHPAGVYLGNIGVLDPMFEFFSDALNWQPMRDPLALDLDGDGIETIGINNNYTFDHSGENLVNGTGWVKADDGFLVLDRNGNGTIDNGGELFGVDTVMSNGQNARSGFQALNDFDANFDGKIDSADVVYAELRVWQDADQDAVTDAGELKTLEELNIASISLNAAGGIVDLGNGNQVSGTASYTRTDGTTGTAYNLDLAINAYERKYRDHLPVPASLDELPDMEGSGRVRDLIQAAVTDQNLAAVLESFSAGTTRAAQMALLDDLVLAWANSSDMKSSHQQALDQNNVLVYVNGIPNTYLNGQPVIWIQPIDVPGGYTLFGQLHHSMETNLTPEYAAWINKLGAIERFSGQTFVDINRSEGVDFTYVTSIEWGEAHSIPVYAGPIGIYPTLSSEQMTLIDKSYAELRQGVYASLVVQTRLKPYLDSASLLWTESSGVEFDFSSIQSMLEERKSTDDVNAYIDLIELNRYAGSNLFLQGWNGLDLLDAWVDEGNLSAGVQQALVDLNVINSVGGSLVATTANEIILGAMSSANSIDAGEGHDQVRGGDLADVINGQIGNDYLAGRAGNDTLDGGAGDDIIDGGEGSDTLFGREGKDHLVGGAGADSLYGVEGDDLLDGGAGNDILYGGNGNDTYLFGRGDGQDTLYNSDLYSGQDDVDILRYDADVSVADIRIDRDTSDALLLINTVTGDKITVSNYFWTDGKYEDAYNQDYYRRYRIDYVEFADGTRWSVDDINQFYSSSHQTSGNDVFRGFVWDETLSMGAGVDNVLALGGNDTVTGGSGNDTLDGGTGDDILDGGDDNDILYGRVGNDHLIGGSGADALFAEAGDDVLDGGTGNDSLYGGNGNDTYLFGRGDGQDALYNSDLYSGQDDVDILRYDADVSVADIRIDRDTSDALLLINTVTGDKITVSNYFWTDGKYEDTYNQDYYRRYRIDYVEFADGTRWSVDDINQFYSSTHQTSGNDNYRGFVWGETLNMGAGADNVLALGGNDTVAGGSDNDTLDGGTGDDILDGGADNDILYGRVGNDQLFGASGIDVLLGEDGNDTLTGGEGADTLYGGLGNDTYVLESSGDVADVISESLNAGTDTVVSAFDYSLGENIELLTLSGATAVNATGNALDNVITGNGIDNVLSGGAGTDTLIGKQGNDTYILAAGDDADVIVELLAEGTDSVLSAVNYTLAANVENLTLTGQGALNGYGNDLSNTLTGNSAANILDGGTGADILIGGLGDDTYVLDSTADVIQESLGEGIDQVQSSVTLTLTANVENLTLIGTNAINGTGNSLGNVIIGNDAANIIAGAAGIDTLMGGLGNDTYTIAASGDDQDVIVEASGAGTDRVNAAISYTLGDNLETLVLTGTAAINGTGNALSNALTGNAAANTLSGGDGNDTLSGAAGIDTLMGGLGNDTYTIAASGDDQDVIVEASGAGTDRVNAAISYTLGDNLETLVLTGTAAINGTGNALSNTLTGNAAANILSGGDGNDTLSGAAGIDTLVGGLGNDIYTIAATGDDQDVIVEASGAGTDQVNSAISYTLGGNLEKLLLTGTAAINGTGNALSNTLTGNAAANILSGGDGNDTLSGAAGIDTLVGGLGNDIYTIAATGDDQDVIVEASGAGTDQVNSAISYTLGGNLEKLLLTGTAAINGTGNALSNTLTGNAAANILSGGGGNDTLTGGAGNDTYHFGLGGGADIIVDTDTTIGNADLLSLDAGVSYDQLWFTHVGTALEVGIIGTSDKVTINGWYNSASSHVERIEMADGHYLLDNQIEQLVQAMAGMTSPPIGQTTLTMDQRQQLDSVLTASWQTA